MKKSKSKHWLDINKWPIDQKYFLNIHIDKQGFEIISIPITEEEAKSISEQLKISISTINFNTNGI